MNPVHSRLLNNCFSFLTISRLPVLADALRLYRPGRVRGQHAASSNDNQWLPADWPFGDFK
jgi:hypothetical protein